MQKIKTLVESCLKESACEMEVRYDEPMAEHSTFKVGGPADCWLKPRGDGFPAFVASLLAGSRREHIPVFILGGGANILVADEGIRGIVLDTGGWAGEIGQRRQEAILEFRAGTSLDDAAEIAAALGLSGLEFLAGMPGSIGGAVWMNARCYEREIADVLSETEIIAFSEHSPLGLLPQRVRLPVNRAEFGYKRSPFQNCDASGANTQRANAQRANALILTASFQLTHGDAKLIRAEMEDHRRDREAKGHYRYPSAGSVFKNNHDFGKPSGKIIDELGLRGLQKGGAQIAPWHGNIIVNTGGATAADIRALIDETAARVKAATGFVLEPEILFIPKQALSGCSCWLTNV